MKETQVRSLGREDPLEQVMATHSSILAWTIPQAEKPGGLVHGVAMSQTRLKDSAVAAGSFIGKYKRWYTLVFCNFSPTISFKRQMHKRIIINLC